MKSIPVQIRGKMSTQTGWTVRNLATNLEKSKPVQELLPA
jgi:hypothetical protein